MANNHTFGKAPGISVVYPLTEDAKVLKRAVEIYGVPAQFDQLEEECAELLLALKHYKKEKACIGDVVEEMADVLIMIHQLGSIHADALLNNYNFKLNRLAERLENEERKHGQG